LRYKRGRSCVPPGRGWVKALAGVLGSPVLDLALVFARGVAGRF